MAQAKNGQAQTQTGSEGSDAPARQGVNSYRVYISNTQNPDQPTIRLVYIQADKYGPAWKAARALVAGGKPHAEVPKTTGFFADLAGKQPLTDVGFGEHLSVATVLDSKPKTVKLSTDRLKAILEDESADPAAQLATLKAMLAGATPTPAPSGDAAAA